MSTSSQRNYVRVPTRRPNYRLRGTVATAIVAVIAAIVMVLTPIATTSSWQYWVSLVAIAVSIWMFFQLEPLPDQGRKRPKSYGRRRGDKLLIVVGASLIAFVAIGRVNRPLSDALVFSFFPGLIIGGLGFGAWTYLVRGTNSFCPTCDEYSWFRPSHGKLFCINCGADLQTTPTSLAPESKWNNSEPVPGMRIMRSRATIPRLGLKPPKCKTCRTPMQLTNVGAFGGRSRVVAVSFFDMPCFVCPRCHAKRFPGEDFGMYLLEEILAGVPRIETERGFRSKMLCPNCKNPVDIIEKTGTFGLQIQLDGLNSFLVDVSMPSTVCPSCQHLLALLTRDMKSTVSDAVLAAFKSTNLSR